MKPWHEYGLGILSSPVVDKSALKNQCNLGAGG